MISEKIGRVIAVQANYYHVRLDNNSPITHVLCTRRTRLKKIGQTVMVGDRVLVQEIDETSQRGAIAEVYPRLTELDRPPIANAEQILLVFAVAEPPLDPWQLSRFLLKAESVGLEICLCFNKTDLIPQEEQITLQTLLKTWGYDPIFVSVATETGIETLLDRLQEKITILAGPSGVGKSSLINILIPTQEVRVGEVSGKLQKGRHTTRHVELFELPNRGLIADSPGFNQPDLTCSPQRLIHLFPEAKVRLEGGNCQFNNCLHRDEPNCMIRGDWHRYSHYLRFLDESIDQQTEKNQRRDQETSLKLKISQSGEKRYEPKLESKKYRRTSRRQHHQSLDQWYKEMEDH